MRVHSRTRRFGRTVAVLSMLVAASVTLLATSDSANSARPVATTAPPTDLNRSGPVVGERYRWAPVKIGGGGFMTGLAFDKTGETFVARTDVHGAYIWNAAQDAWVLLGTAATMPEADRQQNGLNEGVYEVAVAPSRADRIYMITKSRLYRSDDRGDSWVRTGDSGPFPAIFDPNSRFRHYSPHIAVSPENPDELFVGLPTSGVWHSSDGGTSWRRPAGLPAPARPAGLQIPEGQQPPGALIWFAPDLSATGQRTAVAAVPGAGVFIAADGHTFRALGKAGTGPKIVKSAALLAGGGFLAVDQIGKSVWLLRDGTWKNLVQDGALSSRDYASITASPRTGTLILADEGGRIWRSSGNGGSWLPVYRRSVVGKKDPPWLRVADLSYFATSQVVFDPVHSDKLWVAAGTGVFHAALPATPLPLTWESQSRGIEELVANDIIQPDGYAPMFASWDFGIHVKSNLDSFSTTFGPKERVVIAAQQIAWSRSQPSFIVTNASDTRMNCCTEDGDTILAGYSRDAGATWAKFQTLPTPPGTSANDPWRMSFGSIAVAAGDPANIIWMPSFNRTPFYTMDAGQTWIRVILPGERGPNTGSHAKYNYSRKVLVADTVEPKTFYLVHSGNDANAAIQGLWVTKDGGRNWTRSFVGEIAPSSGHAAKLRAVPGHAGHLFFTSAVAGGPDTRLRHSTDGGRSWKTLATIDRVDDLAFGKAAQGSAYPSIYLAGRIKAKFGLWRSVDAGQTWSRLVDFPMGRLDQVTVVGADPNYFGRVYIGYMGSGFVYGEPSECGAPAAGARDDRRCSAVMP